MIISDLNHLEVVSEETSVVGGFTQGGSAYIKFYENFKINKDVDSDVDLKGNLATVESDAYAYGNNTLTQVFTKTVTTGGSSYSSGTSISATD